MKDERMMALVNNVSALESFLERSSSLHLAGDIPCGDLLAIVRTARRKLADMGEPLLAVGLLGGTGVGKSTMMNALAGEPIASTSHRRPHTDAVLLYRHEAASISASFGAAGLPLREHVHDAADIRQIILCDLPDYDSIRPEHRETVTAFLDTLDMVLWVLSPEKYADGKFYDILNLIPKDHRNCYFVLNKADVLCDDEDRPSGQDELIRVVGDLTGHLKRAGVEHPVIYHVSAAAACSERPYAVWNQFPLLRQEVFRRRDDREIRRIKSANIDAELEPVFQALETQRRKLEETARLIRDGAALDDEAQNRIRRDLLMTAVPVIASFVKRRTGASGEHRNILIGPGRIPAVLAFRLRGAATGSSETTASLRDRAASEAASVLKRHVAAHHNSLKATLYRRASLAEIPGDIERALDPDRAAADFEGSVTDLLSGPEPVPAARITGRFRWTQRFAYTVLLVLFIAVLPGEDSWKTFFADPGFRSGMTAAVVGVASLFSPRGLAAMISLCLLGGGLGWYFYGRYRNMSRKREQLVTDALAETLFDMAREASIVRERELAAMSDGMLSEWRVLTGLLGADTAGSPEKPKE